MMKHLLVAGVVAAAVAAVIGGFLALIYGPEPQYYAQAPGIDLQADTGANQTAFMPPDPEQAPPPLREFVMHGYQVLMFTGRYLDGGGGESKNLSCRNCHFEAGRSRDGIGLAGVAGQYPRPAAGFGGEGRVITLEDQVRNCFRANIGREPPDDNGRTLKSVVYYLQWISRGVPVYEPVAWLGLNPLQPGHEPDSGQGRRIYAVTCAKCHGPEGQGSIGPALWGNSSFTTGSQFMQRGLLGSFIFRYMPYKNPGLQPAVAASAAAFVLTRPRPEPGAAGTAETGGPPLAQAAIGLEPAPPLPPKAGPSHEKVMDHLQRIARDLQSKGPAKIPRPDSAGNPQAQAVPPGFKPMTLEEKRRQLGPALPSLKPPKWTSGAVIHPADTKPGHGAGNMLIGIPPEGRRLPQPAPHPADSPRKAEDPAPGRQPERE